MKRLYNLDLLPHFPADLYPEMWSNQREALEITEKQGGSVTLELPTGTGKTAIGYTVLKSLEDAGKGPLFYVTPTKTLVEQIKMLHPDVKVVFGRNEYPCLFYKGLAGADEVACSMLDCPHRVSQETGETQETGVVPCAYLEAKFLAKQGGIVVCTTAFYLFSQLFARNWTQPAGLVIDEAHQTARVTRNCLSYEVTDYHLSRAAKLLAEVDPKSAKSLEGFLAEMIKVARRKPSATRVLLEFHEIEDLLESLSRIDPVRIDESVRQAIKKGKINPEEQREVLKRLEVVTHDVRRYLRSLEFSLPTEERNALNYTYAFYKREREGKEKIQYRLFIKAYYVAPIVQKILAPLTVAYSATIGDPDVFGFETGIKSPFFTLPSSFPASNTGVFLPKDTPNLAMKARSKREPTMVLRKIAKQCRGLADSGVRSLVVVVSDAERQKFLMLAKEEGVNAISYSNGHAPRTAAREFKAGVGDVLVGTVANFGEGVDLPKGLAPVIFFLRPSYPPPHDPATVFEERRFGKMRWRLWNWRVMIEALQVRGRNVRSEEDLGVTFFVSQQFRRFIPGVLPEWLREAYDGSLSLEEGVDKAKLLLNQ